MAYRFCPRCKLARHYRDFSDEWKKNECIYCHMGPTMPDKTFTVKFTGMEFKMNFKGATTTGEVIQRARGEREGHTTAMLAAVAFPGCKVLEIGSCFGYFTLILSKFVGPTGWVLAVESLKSYARIVRRNLEINQTPNVEMLNVCVNNDPSYAGKYNPDKVPVKRVTQILAEKKLVPDLIFMDIEGWEVHVMKDLVESEYLKENRPTIIWECHAEIFPGSGHHWDLAKWLEPYGYNTRYAARMAVSLPGARDA